MEYKKLAESMSDSAKVARYFGERILLTSGSEAIKDLLSTVEELEAKNKRLEQARENANAACAKWEGLYRAELEKKADWVSVRDRLPDNEKPVLAYYGFYREKDDLGARFIGTLTYFSHDPDPHWQHESTGLFVTHWMPLPEPPKEV